MTRKAEEARRKRAREAAEKEEAPVVKRPRAAGVLKRDEPSKVTKTNMRQLLGIHSINMPASTKLPELLQLPSPSGRRPNPDGGRGRSSAVSRSLFTLCCSFLWSFMRFIFCQLLLYYGINEIKPEGSLLLLTGAPKAPSLFE